MLAIIIIMMMMAMLPVISVEKEGGCVPRGLLRDCLPFDGGGKSVVVRDSTGRLGNQMFVVHMLAALHLKFGYKSYMGRRTGNALNTFFGNIVQHFPIAEDTLCEFDEIHTQFLRNVKEQRMEMLKQLFERTLGRKLDLRRDDRGRWTIPPELLREANVPYDSLIHSNDFDQLLLTESLPKVATSYPWQFYVDRQIFDLAKDEFVNGKALILYPKNARFFANESRFISEAPNLEHFLENLFELRPNFKSAAEKTLQFIIGKHEKRHKSEKKKKKKRWTFVGIHSRRTDHLAFERERNMPSLKASYYLQAMDMYREKYSKVIFVYISDDIEWGINSLGNRNKLGDLYFASAKLPANATDAQIDKSVGHDMALMAMCNHTILSHGTFSYWAGFLAGGASIVPQHFAEYRTAGTMYEIFKKHPLKYPLKRLHEFYF